MLGAEIRRAREARGLSIRELARSASLSPEAVSAIERGARYPSLETLERLAQVLRIWVVIGPDETTFEYEPPR